MIVSVCVIDGMCLRRGQLLMKVMYAMGRREDQKKQETDRGRTTEAAKENELFSGCHDRFNCQS
jgi:hypothetical protein